MGVLAALEPMEVKARPGAVAEVRVRVRNDGSRVDGFVLSILGPLAPWASVEPPTLRVPPASEAEARVSFRTPREAIPTAGMHAFGVQVRSVSDPATLTVQGGELDVAPFVALSAELEPRTSRGRRSGWHALNVRNLGNDDAQVAIRASAPDDALRLVVEPPEGEVAPGAAAAFRVRARPSRMRLVGRPRRFPYLVEVSDRRGANDPVSGVFEQLPLLPRWLVAIGVVLVALALGAAVLSGLAPGFLGA